MSSMTVPITQSMGQDLTSRVVSIMFTKDYSWILSVVILLLRTIPRIIQAFFQFHAFTLVNT